MHDSFSTSEVPRPLVIIGAGGHGLEVLWVAARMSLDPLFGSWNVLGFVDDHANLRGRMIEGVPVLGSVAEFLAANRGRPWYFHCAVGSNLQRQKLAEQFEGAGFLAATIMDPGTVLSPRATLGPGCYVAPRCYIGPRAMVGRHVLINVSASIGHHSSLDDYAQACPGVRVNGHCQVGKSAFLGSNAVIHPGKRVGVNATVAAGSFVVRDVPPNTLVVGVPAVAVHHTPSFEFESPEQEAPLASAVTLKTQSE
jgi:sugar O-acyltransferase (sialic acid O-acetyltransferase NeuD family)